MSEVKAFFRHCPSCGRRFHIKLVRKEQVAEETVKEHLTAAEQEMGYGLIHANPMMTSLAEGQPIYVDIDELPKHEQSHSISRMIDGMPGSGQKP